MMTKSIDFVWDLPTRIFHWSLVLAFLGVQITAEWSDSIHELFGYMVLTLVGFRIIWGVFGPPTARFNHLVPTLRSIKEHVGNLINQNIQHAIGHNPLGALMVIILLSTLSIAGITGYLSQTNAFWGYEWVNDIHEASGELSLVLVGIHVSGVAVMSILEGQNLISRMWIKHQSRQTE
jgi:cytochrome b